MDFQEEPLIFERGARGVRKIVGGKNGCPKMELKFITFLKQYAYFLQYAYFHEETRYVHAYREVYNLFFSSVSLFI